jgi:SET family sugar efflux transporter-like MFS transporter
VAATGLFVTVTVGLDVVWAGIVLGVAAAVEIPALLVVGRLSLRVPHTRLLLSGCLAGAVYYAAMSAASAPWMLLALQVFNAWFFAVVAGIGLTLFQRVIPRPGLASGLYANTRRLGAIAAGGLLALGSVTTLGYAGVFLACAALTLAALLVLRVTATGSRSTTDVPGGP